MDPITKTIIGIIGAIIVGALGSLLAWLILGFRVVR